MRLDASQVGEIDLDNGFEAGTNETPGFDG
jgi:hypothetical protein